MKVVSKLALALGVTATVAMPAAAQNGSKKDDKAGGSLSVSKEFREPAQKAATAVQAKDWATAEPTLAALDALAKNDDEKYYATYLRSRMDAQRGNTAGLMKDLQFLLASPKTPPADLPLYQRQYYYMAGDAALKEKKYPEGIDLMLKARAAGNADFDIALSLANAYSATGKPAQAVAEVDKAMQAVRTMGQKPPVAWYQFAIPKVYGTGDRVATAQWIGRMLQDYPTTKNWRWGIMVLRGSTATPGNNLTAAQRADLYRLMRATKVLADQNDYYDYANTVNEAGLPWEAVSVVEEGRSTGKIPAGDADFGRLFASAQNRVRAEGSLTGLVKPAERAASGKPAAQTADAFLASGDYVQAERLYDLALQKGGVDADTINLHRGVALYHLGRKDDARTAFAAVKGKPAIDVATLWMIALDLPPLTAA